MRADSKVFILKFSFLIFLLFSFSQIGDSTAALMSMQTPTNSSICFAYLGGKCSDVWNVSEAFYIYVIDPDENQDIDYPDSITAAVQNTRTGQSILFVLAETGNNTGVFSRGPITTSLPGGGGEIEVNPGDVLLANYQDPDDPSDFSSATAIIKGEPPPPPPGNAFFDILSLDLPSSVRVGQPVQFSAIVKNTGDSGTRFVSIAVDGNIFDSGNVTIYGGDTVRITSEYYTFQSAGNHTVTFDTQDDVMSGTVFVEQTQPPGQEVRFKGKIVNKYSTIVEFIDVQVIQVLQGSISGIVSVATASDVAPGCLGSVDRPLNINDEVEIFGIYDQGARSVDVCSSSSYYIRKIQPQRVEVKFRGKVTNVFSVPDFGSITVQVDEVLSGPIRVGQVIDVQTLGALGACSLGRIDPVQVGDRVEVFGRLTDGGAEACSSSSYYVKLLQRAEQKAQLCISVADSREHGITGVEIQVNPLPNGSSGIVRTEWCGEYIVGTLVTLTAPERIRIPHAHDSFPADHTESFGYWWVSDRQSGRDWTEKNRAISLTISSSLVAGAWYKEERELKPPKADFTWEPQSPLMLEEVVFDPSPSQDPDGRIVDNEWDFDNDGKFEIRASHPRLQKHTFSHGGAHRVCLRVTDNDGLTDTACKEVKVSEEDDWPNLPDSSNPIVLEKDGSIPSNVRDKCERVSTDPLTIECRGEIKPGTDNDWMRIYLKKGQKIELTLEPANTLDAELVFGRWEKFSQNPGKGSTEKLSIEISEDGYYDIGVQHCKSCSTDTGKWVLRILFSEYIPQYQADIAIDQVRLVGFKTRRINEFELGEEVFVEVTIVNRGPDCVGEGTVQVTGYLADYRFKDSLLGIGDSFQAWKTGKNEALYIDKRSDVLFICPSEKPFPKGPYREQATFRTSFMAEATELIFADTFRVVIGFGPPEEIIFNDPNISNNSKEIDIMVWPTIKSQIMCLMAVALPAFIKTFGWKEGIEVHGAERLQTKFLLFTEYMINERWDDAAGAGADLAISWALALIKDPRLIPVKLYLLAKSVIEGAADCAPSLIFLPKFLGRLLGSITGQQFIFEVMSPVEMIITDSMSRRAGFRNGREFEEIPGAVVIWDEEAKMIVLPGSPKEYRIELYGTGHGNVSLRITAEERDGNVKIADYSNIPFNEKAEARFAFNQDTNSYLLHVDFDGDGEFESTIHANREQDVASIEAEFSVKGIRVRHMIKHSYGGFIVEGNGIVGIQLTVFDLRGNILLNTKYRGNGVNLILDEFKDQISNGIFLCRIAIMGINNKIIYKIIKFVVLR
jgi:hypothetical protein